MAYTVENFKTKKQLREAVTAWNEYAKNTGLWKLRHGLWKSPEPVRCYQPGLGPPLDNYTGTITLVGGMPPLGWWTDWLSRSNKRRIAL